MPDPDLPALRLPSPERRESIVQSLSSHFAAGRIELEDLERRLDIAMRAQTLAELDAALADLPEERAAVAERPVVADDRGSRWTLAVLSGVRKRGRWFLSPVHRVVAVMGGGILDLREAQFTAEVTEIRLRAIMGGIEVIVPPDLPVRVQGLGIMGGVADRTTPSEAPRVIIRGFALMGGIEVKVRARKGEDGPGTEAEERPRPRRRLRR